jgi:putative tryptophan/tyrosine transport system substrate-binding protein
MTQPLLLRSLAIGKVAHQSRRPTSNCTRRTSSVTALLLVAVALLTMVVSTERSWAQTKIARIGFLTPASGGVWPEFVAALRALGYVEGQTITFEVRPAGDSLDRLPELAADLVRSKVDVIVAVSPPAILAAKHATSTIPVVMGFWGGEGLLESGLVTSFARPGGNVTGVYMLAAELDAKRFELLLQALPNARKVAVLNPGDGWMFTEVRQAARAAGIQLHITDPPGSEGYDRLFDTMAKARVDAVLVLSFPRFYYDHQRIIEAAAKRRIPAMYEWGEIGRDGGLLAYGPVRAELNRSVASYVDRILKGAKPGDLPIEQPTQFELVVNLRTARALGLTIPQSILQRAEQVIR